MINKITDIVNLVFKDHKHSTCVDCINDIYICFGDNINNKEIKYSHLIDLLFYIFLEYAPYIKPHYWQSIITININTIPMEELWDLFKEEQEKHS